MIEFHQNGARCTHTVRLKNIRGAREIGMPARMALCRRSVGLLPVGKGVCTRRLAVRALQHLGKGQKKRRPELSAQASRSA